MFQSSLPVKSFQIFMTSNIRQSQSMDALACIRQNFEIQVGTHQKAQKKISAIRSIIFFTKGDSFSKSLKPLFQCFHHEAKAGVHGKS